MTYDPLVEEIHKVRARILAECGGELEKYMDRLKAAEDQDHDRLVSAGMFREKLEQKPRSPHRTH